jgi:hypothetical protein
MIILLPKLIIGIIRVSFSCPFKKPHQQLPSTLFAIQPYRLDNFIGREFFNIANRMFRLLQIASPNYHMNMTAHDAISKYFQSFVLLTIPNAFEKNIAIVLSNKNI